MGLLIFILCLDAFLVFLAVWAIRRRVKIMAHRREYTKQFVDERIKRMEREFEDDL